MKKLIILFVIVGLFTTIGAVLGRKAQQYVPIPKTPQKVSISPTSTTQVSSKPSADIPVRISIPKLNVSADVESVGLDAQNRMDVPKDWNNTGWYSLGPRPGNPGNAVIDGHVDTPTGAPSVFYNLEELQKGDIITVVDANGKKYTFSVTGMESYNTEDVPLERVFSAEGPPQLNLITCGGDFDRTQRSYTHRLVVYSTLREE